MRSAVCSARWRSCSRVRALAGAVAVSSPGSERRRPRQPCRPRLAYVTETAPALARRRCGSQPASGGEAKLLGPGQPAAAGAERAVGRRVTVRRDRRQRTRPGARHLPRPRRPRRRTTSISKPRPPTPLAWSPDSRYLAVARQLDGDPSTSPPARGSDVIDTQTGDGHARSPKASIYGASFAPDGSDRLVFALSHSLSAVSAGRTCTCSEARRRRAARA